ncbi:MAG TPA: efflux RND transporter periplasmic adaptor subunit [Ktedonobacterales bacterium]|nr:efflux RND transporter periplasmic adaptor subunit [Ktedonobacterales bacterium]
MLEPRQSSGAPIEAGTAPDHDVRAGESLWLPSSSDGESDLLDFGDDADLVSAPRLPHIPRRVIGAVAIVVILALIIGGVVFAHAATPKPVTYQYTTVRQGTLALTVSGTGPVSAALYNLSFSSSGRIAAIDVQVGQAVTAGQTLAKLDTTALQDSLHQAQLQSYTAYDQEQQALNTCYTAKSPPPDCTQLAENQYAASLQQLKTAQDNLAAATLVASHAGVVTAINGSVGGTPGTGASGSSSSSSSASGFIQIADSSSLQITTSVNEADISGVASGQPATFSVTAYPGRVFAGTVSATSLVGQTTSGVVTYPVTIQVDTSRLQGVTLLTGMTANVTIERARRANVALLPTSAITFARAALATPSAGVSRSQVFSALAQARQMVTTLEQQNPQATQDSPTASWVVERSGNQWVVKPVVLGLTNGSIYEVLSGLSAGDSVVIGEQNGPITTTSSSSAGAATSGFGGGRGGLGGGGFGGGGFGGGAGGTGGAGGAGGTRGG